MLMAGYITFHAFTQSLWHLCYAEQQDKQK